MPQSLKSVSSVSNQKEVDEAQYGSDAGEKQTKLKLDKDNLPLIPQPSDDPADPLNWPQWVKIAILLQASTMALLGPFNQAVVNPAFVPLAQHFHITTVVASYQTTIAIAFAGIGSFIWVPLANTYGRRPVMLFTTLIAAASSLGSGKVMSWEALIAGRVFNGIGTSSFFTLGAAMVSDCFFLHERGRAMGIFTVFLTNSAHIAPIPGGFLGQFVSYRWCYYLPAICDFAMFVIMFFCLPETIYIRGSTSTSTTSSRHPILSRLKLWGLRPEGKRLKGQDFLQPFKMFKYWTVLLPGLYYSYTFTISSILPAVTTATLYKRLYNFTASKTGLALGVGTLIGSSLGELLGGIVVDRSMRRSRKRNDGKVSPEVRLGGIWLGAALVPVGILVWGICIHFKTPFIGPTFGFGITCFAIQIISTVLYAYCADCYKPQTPEIAQVFNFGRQTIGMTTGFWAIPMGDKIGYQWMSVTLALIALVLLLPIIGIMKKGERIRERQGAPNFNKGL